MVKALRTLLVSVALIAGGLVAAAAPAAAVGTTYTVTNQECLGAGTLVDAITKANAHPGADTIELAVDVTGWYLGSGSCNLAAGKNSPARITDPVTIDGKGKSIQSLPQWVTSDGSINNKSQCPSKFNPVIFAAESAGGIEIGAPGVANPGVDVTLKDLTVDGLQYMATVNDAASLSLDNVTATNILDWKNCDTAVVEVNADANLSVVDSQFTNSWNWARTFGAASVGVIQGGGAGNLAIQNTLFESNQDSGGVTWDGKAGSTVNIVSSRFNWSDGISIIGVPGPVTANVVNSAFVFSNLGGHLPAEHIVASGNAAITLQASTVASGVSSCDPTSYEGTCEAPYGVLGTEDGGAINLLQTAIGVADPADGIKVNDVVASGTFTADDQSYVTPVPMQDATALKTLFNQPNLLTDPPALPTINDPEYFSGFASAITPLMGSQQVGVGVLLDVIADSTCTGFNKLVNPIDQSCITKDVLGNDRWDSGNDKRNIGAVQLSLAPHLSVTRIGDRLVEVNWNRPLDPQSGVITGYGLFYRPVSGGSWTRIDITGPTTLSKTVTGLTNGVDYEFKVVGVNTNGDGPASNVDTGIPLGPLGTPAPKATPGNGKATLVWPVPSKGGRTIAGYSIVYRPVGSTSWKSGGDVTSPKATIRGLKNGRKYQFGVTAVATDGTVSKLGTTTTTPKRTLPLRIKGARSAAAKLPRAGRTTVVGSATTLPAGRVKTTVTCRVATPVSARGDLRYCTYVVGSNGSVTVNTLGYPRVVVTVTQQAVPKKGKTAYAASSKWIRSWRTS